MPTTPSGMVQLRERHELLPPGNCAMCGSAAPERRYIDISVYVDLWGQFYFCDVCASEIITALDGLSPIQAKVIEEQMEEARRVIADLQKRNEGLTDDLNAIRRVISIDSASNPDLDISGVLVGPSENEVTVPSADQLTIDDALEGTDESTESTESTKVEGKPSGFTVIEPTDPTGLGV